MIGLTLTYFTARKILDNKISWIVLKNFSKNVLMMTLG